MRELFSGEVGDEVYLAIRHRDCLSDIRTECERLWDCYRELAPQGFIDQFSHDFRGRFWEMHLGLLLRTHHPELEVRETGPDFFIPGGPPLVFVEATSASRGKTADAVPDISKRSNDDGTVHRECALRITAAFREKSEANRARQFSKGAAYVVAVNLPFPEVWLCGSTPLSAQAVLGFGGAVYKMPRLPEGGYDYGAGELIVSYTPSIQKKGTGAEVGTTAFLSPQYSHVSGLLVASVNPLSSDYDRPAIEFLHNPNATHPLPLEWLPVGYEYWVSGSKFHCRNHGAHRRPGTVGSQ